MPFNRDQTSFSELAKFLNERPSHCLFVIGTGVSRSCATDWTGEPDCNPFSWAGLIANGVAYGTREIESFVPPDPVGGEPTVMDLLERADALRTALGEKFVPWLTECYGSVTVREDRGQILSLLLAMYHRGAILMTTNYDQMIATAGRLPLVTHSNGEDFINAITGHSQAVIHIHGTIDRDQVFGQKDYDKVRALVSHQFPQYAAMLTRTVVYLGCGAGPGDDNFGEMLNFLGGEVLNGSGRNDFFVGTASEFSKLADYFNYTNTRLIELSDYRDLPEFTAALIEEIDLTTFKEFSIVSGELLRNLNVDSDLRPSREEILEGHVAVHSAVARARQSMEACGAAYIRGVSGSGKSMAALRIALDLTNSESGEPHQVFWLSMQRTTHEADSSYHLLADKNAVFVVDDGHTNPSETKSIIDAWNARGKLGKLLIVATNTVGEEAADTKIDFQMPNSSAVIHWLAEPTYFEGIARYLARRFGEADTPDPAGCGANAVEIFAANAARFSFGAASRLSSRVSDPWAVTAEDSKAWFAQKLGGFAPHSTQRTQIIALAQVGAIPSDHWVPGAFLPSGELSGALRTSGLIEMRVRGLKAYRLRQPRDAGNLILAVFGEGPPPDDLDARVTAMQVLVAPQDAETQVARMSDLDKAAFLGSIRDNLQIYIAQSKYGNPYALRRFLKVLNDEDKQLARDYLCTLEADPGWTLEVLKDVGATKPLAGMGSLAALVRQVGVDESDPDKSLFDDFASRLASAIVLRNDPMKDCRARGQNIRNISDAIALSKQCTSSDKIKFLEKAWLPERIKAWIPLNIGETAFVDERDKSLYGLSSLLYSVARYQDKDIREFFCRFQYWTLYLKYLEKLVEGKHWSEAIQLVGSLRALGIGPRDMIADRMNAIRSAILPIPPNKIQELPKLPGLALEPEVTRIRVLQRNLWLGIRAWCCIRNGLVRIDRATVSQAYRLIDEHCNRYPSDDKEVGLGSVLNEELRDWLKSVLTGSDDPLNIYCNGASFWSVK